MYVCLYVCMSVCLPVLDTYLRLLVIKSVNLSVVWRTFLSMNVQAFLSPAHTHTSSHTPPHPSSSPLTPPHPSSLLLTPPHSSSFFLIPPQYQCTYFDLFMLHSPITDEVRTHVYAALPHHRQGTYVRLCCTPPSPTRYVRSFIPICDSL